MNALERLKALRTQRGGEPGTLKTLKSTDRGAFEGFEGIPIDTFSNNNIEKSYDFIERQEARNFQNVSRAGTFKTLKTPDHVISYRLDDFAREILEPKNGTLKNLRNPTAKSWRLFRKRHRGLAPSRPRIRAPDCHRRKAPRGRPYLPGRRSCRASRATWLDRAGTLRRLQSSRRRCCEPAPCLERSGQFRRLGALARHAHHRHRSNARDHCDRRRRNVSLLKAPDTERPSILATYTVR